MIKKKVLRESIPFLFIFLATLLILNTFILLPIKLPWDAYYHLSRVNNLSGGLFQFLYPQNFLTNGQIGSITNVFYPSVNMQLIVNLIPKISTNPLFIYKAFIILEFFFSAVIAYIILHFKIKSSIFIATPLSILWATFLLTTVQGGDALGLMAIPTIAYGVENLSKDKEYIFVSIGIILSLYGHLITSLLTIGTVLGFYLITLTRDNKKLRATKNIVKSGIVSLLGAAVILVPIIVTSLSNKIHTPEASVQTFKTWLQSLDFFSSPTLITIALVVAAGISTSKQISRGQIIALFIAIAGTSATCWTNFASSTPLLIIQMPVRIFYYGLFLLLFFTMINISQTKLSKNAIRVLCFSVVPAILVVMFTIHDNLSPSIDNEGHLEVSTSQNISDYVSEEKDGYDIMNLKAFSYSTARNNSFWQLMNYSDYAPKSALANSNSSMMLSDKNGKQIAKHLIVTSTGQNIKTTKFKASPNKISFYSTEKIAKDNLKLPVLGYNGTVITVMINNKKINHTIKDGQIDIHQKLSLNDRVTVKQSIPVWEIIPFIISVVTWLLLLLNNNWFKNYLSKKIKH
ncbi:hypothetical protein [Fructobacillus fructosus]|uniref:hypothetical protein n=1 Tax=Fructobacillus fructosus TaxID=1631 RepID=UPI0016589CB2|nr:hypothetical protein [Fructobacillus fructosus]MBC9118457.1 hypothetical protein [Fructobacillus fructosus]MBD9364934.1 hypothetical protein [Leuconostoc mesenteroides]MCK8638690.1 hypothetical protein [Fructobacillus fructosus]